MNNTHRIKAAADQAVRQRNYLRARSRALTRLANTYPDVYRSYLEEEMKADEQMGKKWLDINGTTAASLVDTRSDSSSAPTSEAGNQGENQSDDGGKA